ncbi:MAG: hypothetical protein HOE90_10440 [Bacteriovoracaceae bacterium]|jgi:hypothetical protein|nr:hypothetical protein [Bacteriovoracaceae bacterium]
MKTFTFLVVLALTTGLFADQYNPLKAEEVMVEAVYTAPRGFDDNDSVQLVLAGKLTNLCYEALNATYKLDKDTNTVTLKQYAYKHQYPECNKIEPGNYLGTSLRFSTVLTLGRLAAGDYRVVFQTPAQGVKAVTFNVAKASKISIDENLYAPVSSAFIPEVIYETVNAEVVLSGALESTCVTLEAKDIEVIKFKNVIVILPKLKVFEGQACRPTVKPIGEVVSLGKMTEGEYLIHVRTKTGNAINRVFRVIKDDDDFKGYPDFPPHN